MTYVLRFLPEVGEDVIIIVFGLFHCARDPHTIRTKLQDRGETDKP